MYLCANMINFDSVDFSGRCPEEVISFFWRSVYILAHTLVGYMIGSSLRSLLMMTSQNINYMQMMVNTSMVLNASYSWVYCMWPHTQGSSFSLRYLRMRLRIRTGNQLIFCQVHVILCQATGIIWAETGIEHRICFETKPSISSGVFLLLLFVALNDCTFYLDDVYLRTYVWFKF